MNDEKIKSINQMIVDNKTRSSALKKIVKGLKEPNKLNINQIKK